MEVSSDIKFQLHILHLEECFIQQRKENNCLHLCCSTYVKLSTFVNKQQSTLHVFFHWLSLILELYVFFSDFNLLIKYFMFETFPIFVHDKFYQGFIYFDNPLINLLEECFMFNLSQELHFYIIVCFVILFYFIFI